MTAHEILDAFRSNPDSVKALREELEKPILREAMAVLRAAGPENYDVGPDVSDTYAKMHLGTISGYAKYPNRLLYLATHPKDNAKVDEDYSPDN